MGTASRDGHRLRDRLIAENRRGGRRGDGGSRSASDDDGQGENTNGEFHDEVLLYEFRNRRAWTSPVTKMVVQVTRTKFTFFNSIQIYFVTCEHYHPAISNMQEITAVRGNKGLSFPPLRVLKYLQANWLKALVFSSG